MDQPKKKLSEIKREAILNAAKEAFKTFGVQQTSMDKLSALAQVSKRTVYNHFASKEDIVITLLSEYWHQPIDSNLQKNLMNITTAEQLQLLLCHKLRSMSNPDYIELAKVAFGHYLFKPEALQQQMQLMAEQENALTIWLTEQVSNQTLTIKDINLATEQLYSLLKGQAFWPQILGLQPPLDAVAIEKLASDTSALFLSHYS